MATQIIKLMKGMVGMWDFVFEVLGSDAVPKEMCACPQETGMHSWSHASC